MALRLVAWTLLGARGIVRLGAWTLLVTKTLLGAKASLLEARTLLGARGRTTRS